MDILAELNPAQKMAVETTEGPLLIIAGPGSGKTRVITHRIAYLIKVCGINPYRILAVTFTNKAAREMQERMEALLGQAAGSLTLGTFHDICARILRQEGNAIGLEPRFTIYDDDDQINLIKQSLLDVGLDPKQYTPRAIQSRISFAKSHLLTPAEYSQQGTSYFDEIVFRVYDRYQQMLNKSQAVDFDDLLMRTVQLFTEHPKILAKYQTRYLHIMVDEFQDTNVTQYQLIKQLAGKHGNIGVVGDPDQSIYSWRFADLRNILSFEKDFPGARVIILEQNYRSTKNILDVATSIISANKQRKPKNLVTDNEEGTPVTVVETFTEGDEAQFIVGEIDRLMHQESMAAGDCAVMYRVNAQSRALEEAFMRHGMPYKLVGGTRFYQRREVKDVIAYLRLIHNQSDNISLTRIINIPGRGIGARTLSDLTSWATSQDISLFEASKAVSGDNGLAFASRIRQAIAGFATMIDDFIPKSKELQLSDFLEHIVEKSGYRESILNEENGEDRWENIMELRTVARDYNTLPPGEALAAFLEKISLVSDVDDLEEKSETTVLTTLHQAKGLEFPVVFIVGMEEGLLPHRRSLEDPVELEEERRLCYVGITRAKKRVYLVHTYRRNMFGSSSGSVKSRFIDDIPAELITINHLWQDDGKDPGDGDYVPITTLVARARAQVPPPPGQAGVLSTGDCVRHKSFGEGVVVSYSNTRGIEEATVNFAGMGTKRLMLSLAPLEKIAKTQEPV
jgi:DNA helicase-2/ATP-dependent DNA helicase PcrA